MIRHAQSLQNKYMEELMLKVKSGEMPISQLNSRMRNGPEEANGGQDANLSSHGITQAKKLGEVWGPLLVNAAEKKRLITFVSPFQRCCLTADPIMKYITKHVPTYKATILPSIMEEGGLTAKKDLDTLDVVTGLLQEGRRKEAMSILKKIKWQPTGQTGKEMLRRFPWSQKPSELSEIEKKILTDDIASYCLPIPKNEKWYKFGWEGSKAEHKRMLALFEWIQKLQSNESGQTGDNITILLFTHGGTIANISNRLTTHAVNWNNNDNNTNYKGEKKESLSLDAIYNTSVTSFFLPSPNYKYPGERPRSSSLSIVSPWKTRVEFFNDTGHLQYERLQRFSQLHLGAKL
jgi:broad specificity phosphatase PhoE